MYMKLNDNLLNKSFIKNNTTTSSDDSYSCSYINTELNKKQNLLNINYYGLNTNITPTKDCYAEVYVNAGGWGYDGAETQLGIGKSGSPTTIMEALGKTNNHNNEVDNVSSWGIYRLTAGNTYRFNCGSMSGGTRNQTGFVRTIDI